MKRSFIIQDASDDMPLNEDLCQVFIRKLDMQRQPHLPKANLGWADVPR